MSVLIKGMEMPKKGEYRMTLYVCDDGYAYVDVDLFPVDKDRFEAILVPPHGRLIDADALMNLIREHSYPLTAHFNSTDYGMFTIGIQQAVDETPTIVEAEEEQE